MSISEELGACGIAVRDDFLRPAQVRALLHCMRERQERGEFAAARIGASSTLQRDSTLRGDRIGWLCEPLLAAEQSLLLRFEQLRLQLNRDLLLGLFELETHYAWYPAGAGYARHLDQPQGRSERRVSLVLYLNVNWHESAGGELKIFEGSDGCRQIEPLAGRLVCFMSAATEHAVLPASRDRFSVTGWFRARAR